MIQNKTSSPFLLEMHHKLQEEWENIEDPSYSRSIKSHVFMTCSKFDYSSEASCGSIPFLIWHQKLIFH